MRFILKHDTLENWEKANPVLMEAEIVSVKEDGFYSLAIGDGTNPFKKLPRIKLQEGLSLKLVHYGNGRIRIRVIEDISGEEEKILVKEEKTISENYAVINGKRIKLTDEQVNMLGVEKRKNPFEKVNKNESYYFITSRGNVLNYVYINDMTDRELYHIINYFNDEQFANQVALHQLLYRKLLKFAYDNDVVDTAEWNKTNYHYYIGYNINEDRFYADVTAAFKHNDVWFSSRDSANHAIEEVIKPFMEEHPEFVW